MDCRQFGPCPNSPSEPPCMCYTVEGDDEINKQFCGSLGPDGKTVYPCAPTCCNRGLGCPGQCRHSPPRRPHGIILKKKVKKDQTYNRRERFEFIILLLKFMIILVTVSTLSLFLRG